MRLESQKEESRPTAALLALGVAFSVGGFIYLLLICRIMWNHLLDQRRGWRGGKLEIAAH